MTRPIKFRAWDKEEKKMFPNNKRVLLVKRNFGEVWNENDNIVWMQSTGLTDKNGKEIYEGDILSYSKEDNDRDWNHGGKKVAPVIYHNGMFVADFGEYEGHESKRLLYDTVHDDRIVMNVIGNIHENPNLLT